MSVCTAGETIKKIYPFISYTQEMRESQGVNMKYLTLTNEIMLYHGTSHEIKEFNIDRAMDVVDKHHAFQGCLFFALNKELSANFGENIYKVLPNGLTALNLGNIEQVKEFADYFLNKIEEIFSNEALCRPWLKTEDFINQCLSIKGFVCDLPNEIINLAEAEGEEIQEEQAERIKAATLNMLPDFIIDTRNIYPEFMLLKNADKLTIAGKC